jgi:NADP-dependent alcohol dehydrogenase
MPATGSEMNGSFVITNQAEKDKSLFVYPKIFPNFAFLDVKVIESIPTKYIRNGICDAYIHVLEQYLTYNQHSLLQYSIAESILKTLIDINNKLINRQFSDDISKDYMLCTSYALNGLIGAGLVQDWSSHMIGHEFTQEYNIDHAESVALIYPAVLWEFREKKTEMIRRYAINVLGLDASDPDLIEIAIEQTKEFFCNLGMKSKLSEYGIKSYDKIISNLKKHSYLPLGESKLIDEHRLEKILERIK